MRAVAQRPCPIPGPVVIGHRGASGHRPEHTLPSYELAIRMGADFVEPDLVATADGVLVARHEPEISATTDVADHPGFASRRTVKEVDGVAHEGWFAEDFTLAELRTLRARERMPDLRRANTAYDGQDPVPTLAEILAMAARLGTELERPVGVYCELKHPTRSAALGLPLLDPLVATLEAAGWNVPGAPVVVESFEDVPLRELRERLRVPLSKLAENEAPDLADIVAYADGVGPAKDLADPTLIAAAHEAGLFVHCWTFRDEPRFRPPGVGAAEEYRAFFAAGVDGVFSDHPDTAVAARSSWMMLG